MLQVVEPTVLQEMEPEPVEAEWEALQAAERQTEQKWKAQTGAEHRTQKTAALVQYMEAAREVPEQETVMLFT